MSDTPNLISLDSKANERYGIAFIMVCVILSILSGWTILSTVYVQKHREQFRGHEDRQREVQALMPGLQENLSGWKKLDWESKVQVVEATLIWYRLKAHAAILKGPEFYARKIDDLIQLGSGDYESFSLEKIIFLLSVMEYDHYKGVDRDELAKQILGPRLYEVNRNRLFSESPGGYRTDAELLLLEKMNAPHESSR